MRWRLCCFLKLIFVDDRFTYYALTSSSEISLPVAALIAGFPLICQGFIFTLVILAWVRLCVPLDFDLKLLFRRPGLSMVRATR